MEVHYVPSTFGIQRPELHWALLEPPHAHPDKAGNPAGGMSTQIVGAEQDHTETSLPQSGVAGQVSYRGFDLGLEG